MPSFSVTQLFVGGFDSNFSYILRNGNEVAVIDPSGDFAVIQKAMDSLKQITLRYILLTHSHHDHMDILPQLQKAFPYATLCAHPEAHLSQPFQPLQNHEQLSLGDGNIEVIYAPGHSKDSLLFRTSDQRALFTGDTLFVDYCGFGNPTQLFETLHTILFSLPDSLEVYSGHNYGSVPHRSLNDEKKLNPYLNAVDFKEFSERFSQMN